MPDLLARILVWAILAAAAVVLVLGVVTLIKIG
jgi:hypothetical protein